MKRTLSLRREHLADLTPAELSSVDGGAAPSGLTCPLADCFQESRLGPCYTWVC